MITPLVRRLVALLFALLAPLVLALPSQAAVTISFHSFNGSVLWGRYPHTFIVFDGTLDATGQRIAENFGFSAVYISQAITNNPAEHVIVTETAQQIARTNRHFSLALSDAQYHTLRAEVERWRDYPGRYYDLDERNCIHFVARMAELLGLRADVPENFLRRPKAWLNYVTRRNPQLGAAEID
jgi:hypothetical protein